MCVCVYARVCVCVCVYARVCVCVCVRVRNESDESRQQFPHFDLRGNESAALRRLEEGADETNVSPAPVTLAF